MGYMPSEGFDAPTHIILYDGAGTRLDVGHNIRAHTPANKFKDGVTLSVKSVFFIFLEMTFHMGVLVETHCKGRH